MMQTELKIILLFGLLFESCNSIGFNDNQKRVTLMSAKYRQDEYEYESSYKYPPMKNDSNNNGWDKGVQECYKGCAKVLGDFPSATFDIGDTIITSFKTYTDELAILTKCNSTSLSTASTSTLEIITLLHKLGRSPSYLLFQFGKALPKVSTGFRDIVTNLSGSIGELIHPVNEAITVVENSLNKVLKQFQNRFVERKQERCEQFDFEEIVKSAQFFTNTVALIAETALNDCDSQTFANEAYEAIAILTFILHFYLIGVQGTNANIATVLHSESESISPFLNSCFKSFDPLIGGIATAITRITFDIAKSMREFLSHFLDLTYSLNERLDDIVGPFGGTTISVSKIKKNLVKSQGQ